MEPFEPELRRRLLAAHPDLTEADIDKVEAMLSDRQDVDRRLAPDAARRIDAERKAFIAEKIPRLREVMMAFDREHRGERAPRKPPKVRMKRHTPAP